MIWEGKQWPKPLTCKEKSVMLLKAGQEQHSKKKNPQNYVKMETQFHLSSCLSSRSFRTASSQPFGEDWKYSYAHKDRLDALFKVAQETCGIAGI